MKKGRRVSLRFVFVIFAVLMIYAAVIFFVQNGELTKQAAARAAVEEQLANIKAQNADLESLIDYSYSDEYVMETARENLKLLMPGEIRFVER